MDAKFILCLLACLPFFSSCDEIEYEINDSCNRKIASFITLRDNAEQHDNFLFFTDPHYIHGGDTDKWKAAMGKKLDYVANVYAASEASFFINGGDWLNTQDTQDEACAKLQYANEQLRRRFQHYYPVLGNHDTNYLGYIDAHSREAGERNGTLPKERLAEILFQEYGRTYYSFCTPNAHYYVLDTGTDWQGGMDEFRWQQLDWLAQSLMADDAPHTTVIQHIVLHDTKQPQFTLNEGLILQAYNARESLTLGNGSRYDFAACSGHVDFIMAGHVHADQYTQVGGVPAIITTTAGWKRQSFDLVMVDYTQRRIHCIRIGQGKDREFSF